MAKGRIGVIIAMIVVIICTSCAKDTSTPDNTTSISADSLEGKWTTIIVYYKRTRPPILTYYTTYQPPNWNNANNLFIQLRFTGGNVYSKLSHQNKENPPQKYEYTERTLTFKNELNASNVLHVTELTDSILNFYTEWMEDSFTTVTYSYECRKR